MIRLSQQQHQCVALLAEGMPDREIAANLGIAYNTVKAHLLCARNKVGATNRVELAVMYVRGAIPLPVKASA